MDSKRLVEPGVAKPAGVKATRRLGLSQRGDVTHVESAPTGCGVGSESVPGAFSRCFRSVECVLGGFSNDYSRALWALQ